ncbi:hypothetical protein [Streptomyces sp. NBC_01477]|uniref:hypothetical protein n=1 Tax=Streptomyces sp. NBC_01477 TaxID=2976015 RepID=UPI002E341A99|nr:hypothetical protein [Streptomyces sp. NBC_01477]
MAATAAVPAAAGFAADVFRPFGAAVGCAAEGCAGAAAGGVAFGAGLFRALGADLAAVSVPVGWASGVPFAGACADFAVRAAVLRDAAACAAAALVLSSPGIPVPSWSSCT